MQTTHPPSRPMRRGGTTAAIALATTAALLSLSTVTATDASLPDGPDCWTDTPGIVGAIDHPTEPTAVVLRMFTGGGFVPVELAFMESPVFTLYGNDVAIYRPGSTSDDITDPLPAYQCTQLTPEQVDELLAFALDEAGLRDAAERYPDPFIVDTPNTVFSIDADGVSRQVVVEALGFNPDAPDPDARAGFEALADVLTDFGSDVTEAATYQVPLYRGLLGEAWPELDVEPQPWPWDDLTVDSFSAGGFPTATLTPDQVALVAEVPSGGQAYIVLETDDGALKTLTIRPLLPDETAAEAAAS